MRYTRYDIKRKKNGNKFYIVAVIIVLTCAILIGTVISNLFLKNSDGTTQTSDSKAVFNQDNSNNVASFVFLQCGIFDKKENAESLMNQLSKIGNPFEVEDEGKVRAMFGIYGNENDYKAATKLLSDNKIDVHDVNYTLSKGDLCDSQIISIINANLQVINKTYDKDVKQVQTSALKEWTKKLDNVDGSYKNKKVLDELKEHVDKLPANFSKDNVNENRTFLYSELKKVSK
ncbi:SPOR domain-containing protein [Clostridium sp.]|jgi:hypothetical protein|uniref:SPOR domain-containing protein n=1 Tax=Clostridium sp. TaxID=1506 RepID=UPI00258A830D|nr:SPOR domain-containing protein [Clostridium sp.]MDF2505798.1 cell division protein [Clostridium sp.]